MIYDATQNIYDAFQEQGLHCTIQETDDTSFIRAQCSAENCDYEILFISRDNDNDVSVRIYNLIKFPAEKMATVCEAVNTCNRTYRFLRFVADDDNTVVVNYDIPLKANNVGEIAVEICIRSMRIVSECYSLLMHALYA